MHSCYQAGDPATSGGKHARLGFYSMTAGRLRKRDMGEAIRPHLKAVWRFALSLSGDPTVADDLTQSTCLRAIEQAAIKLFPNTVAARDGMVIKL